MRSWTSRTRACSCEGFRTTWTPRFGGLARPDCTPIWAIDCGRDGDMNTPTPKILASLRSADRTDLDGELRRLTEAGIDGLHVDVMDGSFVDESWFDPDFVAGLRSRTRLMI